MQHAIEIFLETVRHCLATAQISGRNPAGTYLWQNLFSFAVYLCFKSPLNEKKKVTNYLHDPRPPSSHTLSKQAERTAPVLKLNEIICTSPYLSRPPRKSSWRSLPAWIHLSGAGQTSTTRPSPLSRPPVRKERRWPWKARKQKTGTVT